MEQRKRIFGALDDLMRSPIGERLRERMFRELSTKEIHDMLQKEQKPYKELMAYYQCALMEVETKFRVLNEQFSLVHDRNPIESITAEGRKVDLVRRNGWAGFELDTGYRLQGAEAACGYTAAFQSVIGEGPIRVVETAEERRRGLAAIMRQATCCGDWTFPDAAVDAVCVLRLDAEELSCKEHL